MTDIRMRIDDVYSALHGLPLNRRLVILEVAFQKLRQQINDQEDEFRHRVEKEHTQ
jgi:hypothetical protein